MANISIKNVPKEVAIIILNYNSSEETKRLVNNIREKENSDIYDIIIVDNGSSNNDVKHIEEINDCKKIMLEENGGYAKGNNVGINYAVKNGYSYMVVANSDIELIENDTIKRLIDAMEREGCSIIGPQILDRNKQVTAGAVNLNRFGRVHERRTNFPTTCQGLIGAFFVIKSDVIKTIGLIKEFYFLYLEETDYFYNCYKSDLKILYYPEISVIHYGGETTSKVYDYYISRNRFILVEENFNTPKLFLTVFLFFEFIITDIKQFLACKAGIRNYDYRFRRKMRWYGFKDGLHGIRGKKF